MMNWLIDEIMWEQRRQQLDRLSPHALTAKEQRASQEGGVRRAVATALIRLGTALDHDAAVRRQVTSS